MTDEREKLKEKGSKNRRRPFTNIRNIPDGHAVIDKEWEIKRKEDQ